MQNDPQAASEEKCYFAVPSAVSIRSHSVSITTWTPSGTRCTSSITVHFPPLISDIDLGRARAEHRCVPALVMSPSLGEERNEAQQLI